MDPPPADSPSDTTGPPDRPTLRLLERHLAREPSVTATAFEPEPYEPRRLRVGLDTVWYPESVESVRLDVRWFESGDFSFHYVETDGDSVRWECRWDRHPNEHNSRVHFHRPPDGTEIVDLSLDSLHPLDVFATVLDAVERRVEDQWTA